MGTPELIQKSRFKESYHVQERELRGQFWSAWSQSAGMGLKTGWGCPPGHEVSLNGFMVTLETDLHLPHWLPNPKDVNLRKKKRNFNPIHSETCWSNLNFLFFSLALCWLPSYECRIQHEPGMWAKKRPRGHFRGFSHPVMRGTELLNGQGLAWSRGVVEDFSRSCVSSSHTL